MKKASKTLSALFAPKTTAILSTLVACWALTAIAAKPGQAISLASFTLDILGGNLEVAHLDPIATSTVAIMLDEHGGARDLLGFDRRRGSQS